MAIRLMRDEDVDTIRRIDSVAFSPWWQKFTGEQSELPPRTRNNILALREKDPEGCFVAEVEGNEVGFIFSRTWGRVGWFGTFGVLPQYQGRGIGSQLIHASLQYLSQDPRRVIGLETMPESPDNLGLYLKQGFEARLLTLLLSQTIDPNPPGVELLPCWSHETGEVQESWLADLRRAAGQIAPGMDYTKEILSTARHGLGETLILTENQTAIGMCIVWFTSSREGMDEEWANIQALMIHPGQTDEKAFQLLLDATASLAHSKGKGNLSLPVNAQHCWAVDKLLAWNYQIDRAMVRMVLQGTDKGPKMDRHVDLSRWAG